MTMEDDNSKTTGITMLSTKRFAYFIVDGLINEQLIKAEDLERAVNVVIDELNVRKAIGDYDFKQSDRE